VRTGKIACYWKGEWRRATSYFWYNGSTSDPDGERVGETEVKATGEKQGAEPKRAKRKSSQGPHRIDPKRSELSMSKLKC